MPLRTLRNLSLALALLVPLPIYSQDPPGVPPPAAPLPAIQDPEVRDAILARIARVLDRSAFVPGVDFDAWAKGVEELKPQLEKVETDEAFTRIINGSLAKFGLSHIVLQTPRDNRVFRTGETVGIGVSTLQRDEGLVIMRVISGGAASEAGIVPGDTIIEVEGKKPEGVARITGPEGSEVRLKIRRKDGSEVELKLKRKKFSTVRPEELSWVNADTAMLTVYTFGPTYNAKNVESLMSQARGAKNLILDLRDNPGGVVLNMQHLLGFLLPGDQPVGTFITRDLAKAFEEESGKKLEKVGAGEAKDSAEKLLVEAAEWSRNQDEFRFQQIRPIPAKAGVFEGKLVVLVNEGSGSASEISAAALRENRGAMVVGRRSAGAVLVSTMASVGSGFFLQFPLSDYVTGKGLRLEGNGVTPDAVSAAARVRMPGDPDETVALALEQLKKISETARTRVR